MESSSSKNESNVSPRAISLTLSGNKVRFHKTLIDMMRVKVTHIKLWVAFWVDNDTHFRSFYGHFHCFKETASIVCKTNDAITDG